MKLRLLAALVLFGFLNAPLALRAAVLTQSNGVTFVGQPDPAADLVGTEIMLRAGLDRETPAQNGLAALVAECILQSPAQGGETLLASVTDGGGSLSYRIEGRIARFYLEGMASSYGRLLALFRSALSRPDFSAATLARARAAVNLRRSDAQRLALNVGIDMLNRAFYTDSDAGLPPYGLPEALAGFTGSDAAAFYAAHYRRGDAAISVVGNYNAADAYAQLLDVLPPGGSSAAIVHQSPLASSSRQLIARRDVPVPWLVAQYPAPDLRSADFGPMLVLTAFMERTLADVASVPGIATRSSSESGVGTLYNFDARPANVIFYVDGGMGDPTRTFATALTVVNVLGHAKLQGSLSDMKTFAAGRFLLQATTLQDRAWLAGVFTQERLPADYLSAAVAAIDRTNAADLQRVASRYLGAPTIALVLPRGT